MTSHRLYADARAYMRDHPGVKYTAAREIVRSQPVDVLTPDPWLQALGLDALATFEPRTFWKTNPWSNTLRVPLGVSLPEEAPESDDPRIVSVNLNSVTQGGDGPHGLIAGKTGTGKTELITRMALTLAMTHSPDTVRFLFVSARGNRYDTLEKLPHTLAALYVDRFHQSLVWEMNTAVEREVSSRKELLSTTGMTSIDELEPALHPGHIVVFLDGLEIDHLLRFGSVFDQLYGHARGLGIHLVSAVQGTGLSMHKQVVTDSGFSVVFSVKNDAESRAVLGSAEATYLPIGGGEAYLSLNSSAKTKHHMACFDPTGIRTVCDRVISAMSEEPAPKSSFAEDISMVDSSLRSWMSPETALPETSELPKPDAVKSRDEALQKYPSMEIQLGYNVYGPVCYLPTVSPNITVCQRHSTDMDVLENVANQFRAAGAQVLVIDSTRTSRFSELSSANGVVAYSDQPVEHLVLMSVISQLVDSRERYAAQQTRLGNPRWKDDLVPMLVLVGDEDHLTADMETGYGISTANKVGKFLNSLIDRGNQIRVHVASSSGKTPLLTRPANIFVSPGVRQDDQFIAENFRVRRTHNSLREGSINSLREEAGVTFRAALPIHRSDQGDDPIPDIPKLYSRVWLRWSDDQESAHPVLSDMDYADIMGMPLVALDSTDGPLPEMAKFDPRSDSYALLPRVTSEDEGYFDLSL